MSSQSKIAFAKWLQKNDPFLFRVAVARAKQEKAKKANLHGISDMFSGINWADLSKTVVDTVQKTAPSLIQFKTQAKLLKLNMERAKSGLPPVNSSDYAPTVKIAPEITPESEAAINRMAQQAVNTTGQQLLKMAPWVMAAVVGAVALPKILKR